MKAKLPEEMVLITQSFREVEQIMNAYVGIGTFEPSIKARDEPVRDSFRETEDLFERSVVSTRFVNYET